MTISLIAAVSENGVIGTGNGGIPWDMPRDKAHFRNYTAGKWMLLGRKTFLEMEGWFSDQTPVVLSRSDQFEVPGGYRVETIEAAVALAQDHHVPELVVSGGATIYELSLPFVNKIVLTRIHAKVDGEIFFPDVPWEQWQLEESIQYPNDDENPYNMSMAVFVPNR